MGLTVATVCGLCWKWKFMLTNRINAFKLKTFSERLEQWNRLQSKNLWAIFLFGACWTKKTNKFELNSICFEIKLKTSWFAIKIFKFTFHYFIPLKFTIKFVYICCLFSFSQVRNSNIKTHHKHQMLSLCWSLLTSRARISTVASKTFQMLTSFLFACSMACSLVNRVNNIKIA